jgi:hypothetical protein
LSFLRNIRSRIGSYLLEKEKAGVKRDPAFMNMNDAKTIGILFEASNAEDFELVKRYVIYLREMKKKVKVIGYFSENEIPQLTYSKLEYDFVDKKQLSWHMKPSGHVIDNFIEEQYDILIDLNIHDHLPLKYIAVLSRARFKVGKTQQGSTEVYDLSIDHPADKSLKYFLRQVDTYLLMINKSEDNAA